MTSPEKAPRIRLCGGLLFLFAAMLALAVPAQGQESDGSMPQAWLLTYGPGEVYWQRFGHNAIWIRDPALGLDHTFNFGFFDFAQPGFLGNFLQGRLNYFAAARPAEVELAEYIDEDRSVRAQRLDLTPAQLEALTQHLLTEISAAHREYLYDYYRHNCSTRVRDAIDLALDGALHERFSSQRAPMNYRDHTRRLTGMDFWLYLGLETGLGSPVDAPANRWQEGFIPGVLARAVEETVNPMTGRPLVVEDVMLYESSLEPPPTSPRTLWPRYLVLPILLLGAAFGATLLFSGVTRKGLAVSWLVFAGLAGAILAYLWWATDHWASARNLNLLLLNPLWLLIALVPALRRPGAWLLAVCGGLSLVASLLPPAQYNADVVAAVLPVNLAVAWALLRRASSPDLGQ